MRGLLLVGCVVLAGCDDAVVLEVHPASNVPTETVQLFIGLGECGDCPGIQPPNVPAVLPGHVLFREDSYRETVVRTARVEGGVARFRIESSDVGSSFTLAVAVDGNGRSAAVIQSLPLDRAGRYRVDLIEANTNGGGLGPKPATTNGSFVGIWQQPGGSLPCMGFEHWSSGRLDERVFIVPQDDLDCDARVGDAECAPFGYDATGVPTFDAATCTTETPLAPDGKLCSLGGPACNEVTGMQHACAPTDYCLPSAFCDTSNTACGEVPASIAGCLFGTTIAPKSRLKCTIPFQPGSDNLHADLCSNDLEMDVSTLAPVASGLGCAGPPDRLWLPSPAMTRLAFEDTLTLVTENQGTPYTLAMKARWTFENCRYRFELNGEKAIDATSPSGKPPFIQLWLSRGGGALRKLLLPVEIQYVNDCGREPSCQLITELADSIAGCLR